MIAELKQAQECLNNKGIENACREAERIFCHFLKCKTIDLYISDIAIDTTQKQAIDHILKQRMAGEPLQYILGETEFYGYEFKIQKGVFIPRPETEILVDTVLAKLRTPNSQLPTNILDLCTGCGNIAISLTKLSQHYKIFASDVSQEAVRLTRENARSNGITGGIEIRYGDLFGPWEDKKGFFDVIACNPPYVKNSQLKYLPGDVKNEPAKALDGGEDGLDFYRKIISEAPLYFKGNGYIFFEISPEIAEGVKDILNKDFCNIEIVKDYNNRDRVISAQWINYSSKGEAN